MNDTTTTIEATIATAGSKATYTGAGMTIGGGIFSNELAVAVGVIVGVVGLAVNWYYKHKLANDQHKLAQEQIKLVQSQAARESEEHNAKMGQY